MRNPSQVQRGLKGSHGKVKRRAVVPAQQLRAEAALLIDWLRLSLRHGWIGSWSKINKNTPVVVGDDGRLKAILRARLKRALQLPYGRQAVLLGLAKPPPDDLAGVASAIVAPAS